MKKMGIYALMGQCYIYVCNKDVTSSHATLCLFNVWKLIQWGLKGI